MSLSYRKRHLGRRMPLALATLMQMSMFSSASATVIDAEQDDYTTPYRQETAQVVDLEVDKTAAGEDSQDSAATDGIEQGVEDRSESSTTTYEEQEMAAEYQAAIYVDATEQDDEALHNDAGQEQMPYDDPLQNAATQEVILPGEEIDFEMRMHSLNFHLIQGRADSDIGKVKFKSRLMPSNEVKLSITMKQTEAEDVALTAYFDLANYTMELDGANAVLNEAHKALIEVLDIHLRHTFEQEYQDMTPPEHAFMLVQMLSYWSVSPAGYVHEKRSIVSN